MTLYSVKEVAEILSIRVQAVRALIANKSLTACDISLNPGGRPRWRVESEVLTAFIRSRSTSPPPKYKRRRKKEPRKFF
jgi:hypothetical protein